MHTEHAIALMLIVFGTGAGIVVTTLSQRARDVAFFALVAGAVLATRVSVNFFSLEWYRGTTRGVEVTALDVVAVSLIAASLLTPRYRLLPRIYWPAGLGFMLLYASYCLFSVLTSHPMVFGAFELTKILRGIMFFLAAALFVRTRRELQILVAAVVFTVLLQGTLALTQRYLGGIHRVGGSVEDTNSLSMYICLATPLLAAAASVDFPWWLRQLCWASFGAAASTTCRNRCFATSPIRKAPAWSGARYSDLCYAHDGCSSMRMRSSPAIPERPS